MVISYGSSAAPDGDVMARVEVAGSAGDGTYTYPPHHQGRSTLVSDGHANLPLLDMTDHSESLPGRLFGTPELGNDPAYRLA